jgi:hypothetical protein
MGINPVMQGSSKGIILWRSFADDETARSFDLSGAVPHLYGRNSLFPRKLIAQLYQLDGLRSIKLTTTYIKDSRKIPMRSTM